jgi:ABC-type antimicrobial peptide transport system permease subunit
VTRDRALQVTYLRYELRHRWGQALCTAAGLAVGVALVIIVSAAAAGAGNAETSVLNRLEHEASSNSATSTIGGAAATATGLAAHLGTWVATAALTASFVLAALLTLASVARRVREFGTLKALGWQARRITAQVLAETVTVGIAGTLAGVVLGCAGTALITALGPALTVSVTQPAASLPPPGGTAGGSHASPGNDGPLAVPVHLSAQTSPGIVAVAVALGILGALLAGTLGAWRAARLSPATALARSG